MSNVSTASWTASAQRLTQPVVSAITATAQIFIQVAKDTYTAAVTDAYDTHFANLGFKKCEVSRSILCYSKNVPAQPERAIPVPGGRGERIVAAKPLIDETYIVNLANGVTRKTTCTDQKCQHESVVLNPEFQTPRVKSQVAAVQELDDETAGSFWRQRY